MENAPFFVDNEKIILRADGQWVADDVEITHEGTCRMFFRGLEKDTKGYIIRVGRESKRVDIEDCAFFITRIEGTPSDGYELWLSDGTQVGLDPANLKYRPGRLSSIVMTRIGEEEAKFLRGPYFELLSYLEEDDKSYFLNFGGSKISLAKK